MEGFAPCRDGHRNDRKTVFELASSLPRDAVLLAIKRCFLSPRGNMPPTLACSGRAWSIFCGERPAIFDLAPGVATRRRCTQTAGR